MNVIDSLHFFCSPCELEVFKLVDKHHGDRTTPPELTTCDVSEVTTAITVAIKGLQDALQKTFVSAISRQFSGSLNFTMQSSFVEEDDVDISQEMDCQSQQIRASNPHPKSVTQLRHEEIIETVSSVLKEEKEKSKRKLNIILHNIPESDDDNVDVRKEHDTDTVKAIINQCLSILAPVLNVTRLARKGNKPLESQLLLNRTRLIFFEVV